MQHDALRLIRVFHDLSQSALAEKLSISKSYLSEIESGEKKNLSVELLERYAKVFNVPVSSLLFFSEQLDGERDTPARKAIATKIVKMLDWVAAKEDI